PASAMLPTVRLEERRPGRTVTRSTEGGGFDSGWATRPLTEVKGPASAGLPAGDNGRERRVMMVPLSSEQVPLRHARSHDRFETSIQEKIVRYPNAQLRHIQNANSTFHQPSPRQACHRQMPRLPHCREFFARRRNRLGLSGATPYVLL